MTDHYAVFGNPIAHSKSPQIHHAFARQMGMQIDYRRIRCEQDAFTSALRGFFANGGSGCNVTVPFKQQAFESCDHLSAAAALAGAVNTVYPHRESGLCGDNSDGAGLARDLVRNLQCQLAGRHLWILGAGGATRGIIGPLAEHGPASITLINRTLARAQELIARFNLAIPLRATSADAIPADSTADILINATSASLSGTVPAVDALTSARLLTRDSFCYDLAYAAEETPFIEWARRQGVRRTADGIGMLVEQAAVSFQIWTGAQPETRPVIQALAQGELPDS